MLPDILTVLKIKELFKVFFFFLKKVYTHISHVLSLHLFLNLLCQSAQILRVKELLLRPGGQYVTKLSRVNSVALACFDGPSFLKSLSLLSDTTLSDISFAGLFSSVVAVVQLLSCVQLFCNPMDCTLPGSWSMGFPRQKYWSGLAFPPPGDLLDLRIKPTSPALADRFFTTEPSGKPYSPLPSHSLVNFSRVGHSLSSLLILFSSRRAHHIYDFYF